MLPLRLAVSKDGKVNAEEMVVPVNTVDGRGAAFAMLAMPSAITKKAVFMLSLVAMADASLVVNVAALAVGSAGVCLGKTRGQDEGDECEERFHFQFR